MFRQYLGSFGVERFHEREFVSLLKVFCLPNYAVEYLLTGPRNSLGLCHLCKELNRTNNFIELYF